MNGTTAVVKHIAANGIPFAYLEKGSGPPMLLLPGFPNNAHIRDDQFGTSAKAGYRGLAPFLCGHSPTEASAHGVYGPALPADDVHALIRALFGAGDFTTKYSALERPTFTAPSERVVLDASDTSRIRKILRCSPS